MKRAINVIDLDKTLIPYDSFRVLIKKEILKFNFPIIFLTFFRILKIQSSEDYKRKVTLIIGKKYNLLFFKEFAKSIYMDIDTEVLAEIQLETKEGTLNILLSASPNIYVKHLIDKLGWMGSGSYFDNSENFIHLYGKDKIKWLDTNYKMSEYVYNFAISDSSTDDELLSLFGRKLKWILQ